MQDVRDSLMVGRASDGTLVRRPLSPHLQVYRWPVTMAASILNRMTGIAISVGTLLMVWWLVAAAASPRGVRDRAGLHRLLVGMLLLFGWTAALFYHFFAGLRHLAWDCRLRLRQAGAERRAAGPRWRHGGGTAAGLGRRPGGVG